LAFKPPLSRVEVRLNTNPDRTIPVTMHRLCAAAIVPDAITRLWSEIALVAEDRYAGRKSATPIPKRLKRQISGKSPEEGAPLSFININRCHRMPWRTGVGVDFVDRIDVK